MRTRKKTWIEIYANFIVPYFRKLYEKKESQYRYLLLLGIDLGYLTNIDKTNDRQNNNIITKCQFFYTVHW